MLGIHFDKKELKQQKKRIERIASGEAIGGATKAAVEAVQAAMIAAQSASMVAVIASMTVNN